MRAGTRIRIPRDSRPSPSLAPLHDYARQSGSPESAFNLARDKHTALRSLGAP